ncbi:unnamed protein product [Mycena citricolor]|uniref:N1221-domain-containing protein n=1 Tax=Mycena citricolor TaxID=2018698 RepID=A0AAD2Q158_9AGAR|nr:unnamed protein product [Mycena citricolor]
MSSMSSLMSIHNQPPENASGAGGQGGGIDSISLGQLKQIVATMPKERQWWYDYKYDDEDTVMNEIDEFYSYVEMPQVAENLRAWEGSFSGEWTKSPLGTRRSHVDVLLESLEHKNAEIRFTNARRLFYILQGTFAETVSPEHQLHWIFENCKIVRNANGLSSIIEALKIATSKHDLLCGLSDADAEHIHISAAEKADFIEEAQTEISVYLGMLYHLVEIFKGHDDFADELMSFDPPLPVYLFSVVAGLRDKSAKGYPVKKLLLVLWKTLLSCCGGVRDHARVKKLARELGGLPAVSDADDAPIKTTPLDMETFHQETTVKYPTFTQHSEHIAFTVKPAEIAAPKPITITTSRLAQAYSPITVRHHYHHEEPEAGQTSAQFHPYHATGAPGRIPQPATPAPSPPPIPQNQPKPKKQQYQTDQSRPFLFPFGMSGPTRLDKDARLVPFAVDEADRLYHKHMYVSLALWQMYRTRQECMTAESGLEKMPGSEGEAEDSIVFKERDAAEPFPDVALLDAKLAEIPDDPNASSSERRRAKERKEDLMRLKRNTGLPIIPNMVLVLLKFLLATVTATSNMQPPPAQGPPSASSVFPPGPGFGMSPDQPLPPSLSSDDIDVMRHREVTSKAISAILLLLLKWFKVSHIMKFHYLGQLLLDSNCLLLILKLFSVQDVSQTVISRADCPDNNFFRYCMLNFSKNPQPADSQQRPTRYTTKKSRMLPNGEKHEEDIDMVTDFSWRNFFSLINFAKIVQKLSKSRGHRIWLLIQYKSSPVLKRALKIQHPMLQLHILKIIKSQVPFCGRKWRQSKSNMKIITSIYLNCRPDLRDEWLSGTEVEDATDAQAQEHALRHLVKFYNNKRYGPVATQHGPQHRRSGSMSHHLEGLHPGPELGLERQDGTNNIINPDVFPPVRSQAADPRNFLPYITEDIAFEEEYEDYLSDLGWSDSDHEGQQLFGGTSAWHRLPSYAQEMADGISDSESIVSIGELGDDARLDPSRDDPEVVDENLNNWEHMSPKTMAALPKSPAGRRRSSQGTGLRPVLPFGLDDGITHGDENDSEDDDIDIDVDELGPSPREQTSFSNGAGVDEVEYAYGV